MNGLACLPYMSFLASMILSVVLAISPHSSSAAWTASVNLAGSAPFPPCNGVPLRDAVYESARAARDAALTRMKNIAFPPISCRHHQVLGFTGA